MTTTRDRLLSLPLLVALGALPLVACLGTYTPESEEGERLPPDPGAVNDPGGPGGPDGPGGPGGPGGEMNRCDPGRSWLGFDGAPLDLRRVDAPAGADGHRVKPYSALAGEYARVLGKTPASLASLANTFGAAPERWYDEPQASAVSIYASLRVAFQGCLAVTGAGAKYAAGPDAASAATECGAWAQAFWSRAATPQEIDACVRVAVEGTAKEPDARRRWAYACASVLSAAGFLAY